MKVFASFLLLFVLVMIAVDAHVPPVRKPKKYYIHNVPSIPTFPGQGLFKPKPNVPSFPNFPGHGSFNPYARPIRFRRSLEEERGKIHIHGGVKNQSGSKPEVHIDGSVRKGYSYLNHK